MTLVKDEKYFDKFDRAFGAYFHGIAQISEDAFDIPLDWLKKGLEREFTAEEKKTHRSDGWHRQADGALHKELMDEQKERHEGGNKWIGTGVHRRSGTADTTRKAFASAVNRRGPGPP